MRGFWYATTVLVLANAAAADPISGKDAKTMLFSPKGAVVEMMVQDFLSPADVAALAMVAESQPYYGAVAVSPDEGLMVEATVAAANYHDTEAASVVAKAECDAKRKGTTPCMVVALIRPKDWEARAFQLSAAATEGFRTDYKGQGPIALAISPKTGLWGIAAGEDAAEAAVATCTGKAEVAPKDCAVAVAD